MSIRILPLFALLPLVACADIEAGLDAPSQQAPAVTQVAVPVARPVPVAPPPTVRSTPLSSPASAPVTSPAARDALSPPPAAEGVAVNEPTPAAAPAPAPTGRLGTTVASLGPTEPGLWLETALVSAPTQGRIEYNGQSVSVQLRPSGGDPGSGSQISLEAMRAIGAPLTGLPELSVYGG